MNILGNKIKEIRKAKGLSQEDLAERAKVSLRTIQRIENNESEPHGKTLQLICSALNVGMEEILDYGKNEDRVFMVWFHLSVLSVLAVPLGNIILPLILWLTKRDKITNLDKIGKNVLAFQILWTVFSWVSLVLFFFSKIEHWDFRYTLYSFLFFYAVNILISIVSAIMAYRNSKKSLYPNLFFWKS